jgi:hypothetical protein
MFCKKCGTYLYTKAGPECGLCEKHIIFDEDEELYTYWAQSVEDALEKHGEYIWEQDPCCPDDFEIVVTTGGIKYDIGASTDIRFNVSKKEG